MKKIIVFLSIFSFLLSPLYALEDHVQWPDWVDVTVSPTRYELSGWTGQTVTKPIKVINNSDFPVTFTTTVENCRPKDTSWTPDCSINNDFSNPNTQLSSWLSLSESSFTIAANSEKNVTFTVNVPWDASPWSHFWAVFFSTGQKAGQIITTEKRIWVLILFNVDGDTVTEWAVDSINIAVSGDGWGWASGPKITKDILWTLKETVFWVKNELVSWAQDIVSNISSDEQEKIKKELALKEKQKNEKLTVDFDVTFVNSGNTHIKPDGKIIILDDGKVIPKVSKELIKNENDAIIWEKIVDYIPINDQWGNVLPDSKRTFEQEWNWFPYEVINEKWEREVRYRNFSEYYSNKNLSERQVLMFWEQVKVREKSKKLTAKIEIWYNGEDDKKEEFNSAREFNVVYNEQYIWYNWFIMLVLGIFWCFFGWWIINALKRRKKEDNEIKRLKKRLKEQEKEIDKIEDLVEDMPVIVAATKRRKKKEEGQEEKWEEKKRKRK
jgi:hypothetical protein